MSGTSADGTSLALLEEKGRKVRVLAHATYTYPDELRTRILESPAARAPELAELSFLLGRLYARHAKRFLKAKRCSAKKLSVIGSHGQTVIHQPDGRHPYTLQIGDPSFLAEELGVPVVSDFRPRDMAAGGQGAPLVPFLDEELFGGSKPRVLLNIGGIANLSVVGKKVKTLAFDTGPGNCLIDLAMTRVSRGEELYDKGGRTARKGLPDMKAVRSMLKDRYFKKDPPKSLDLAYFGARFFDRYASHLKGPDLVATFTHFTALTVSDQLRRFVLPSRPSVEIVVSGGGTLNKTLMEDLVSQLAPLPVVSSEEYGMPPMAKESALIALMALRNVQGRVNHCPGATGAKAERPLGVLSLP